MTTPTVNQLIELKRALPQLEQLTRMRVALDDRRSVPIYSIEVRDGRAIIRFGDADTPALWRTLGEFLSENWTLVPRRPAGWRDPDGNTTPTEQKLIKLTGHLYRRGEKAWNLTIGWRGDGTEDVTACAACGDEMVELHGISELRAWIDGADEIIPVTAGRGGAT